MLSFFGGLDILLYLFDPRLVAYGLVRVPRETYGRSTRPVLGQCRVGLTILMNQESARNIAFLDDLGGNSCLGLYVLGIIVGGIFPTITEYYGDYNGRRDWGRLFRCVGELGVALLYGSGRS